MRTLEKSKNILLALVFLYISIPSQVMCGPIVVRPHFSKVGIRHLAIIPDGNRRWAKKKGQDQYFGHAHAFKKVLPELLSSAYQKDLHTCTVWLFSTENWKREPREVEYLMDLYRDHLEDVRKLASENDVKVVHLGRTDRIPEDLRDSLEDLVNETQNNESRVLNIALDYGGLDEIHRASKKPGPIEDNLDTSGQLFPNPDMIVRTSGERRLSGFMTYQSSYSELMFTDFYFPDFDSEKLDEVCEDFAERQRRYGQ